MADDSIQHAIDAVYSAFSHICRPQRIPGCEHCLPAEEAEILIASNQSSLSADQISSYAADVFLTVGSVEDFQYYLPRILELSVNDQFFWPNPEVALGKLGLAKWSEWPDSLSNPVRQLLNVQFERVIQGGDPDKIDEWLCGIGRCQPDIQPYLARIETLASPEALVGFILKNLDVFKNGKPANSFWDDAPENAGHLTDWMKRDPAKTFLEETYGMQVDTE